MEVGKKYKFTIPREGKGSIQRTFTGQVIQICDRHITLKHSKLRFNECFQKVDLRKWGYKEVQQ